MCTVTVVKQEEGYILTSNRDETMERAAAPPKEYVIDGFRLMFPRDSTANGSWIALREGGYSVCLLNGAREKHQRNPPYRLSRGQLLLQLLASTNPLKRWKDISLREIEPFTLVLLNATSELYIGIWNEKEKETVVIKDDSLILSSSTLYDDSIRGLRRDAFNLFLSSHDKPGQYDLMQFHQSSFIDDKTQDFLMERGDLLRTLSTTQVQYSSSTKPIMRYKDYLTQELMELHFGERPEHATITES